MTISDEQESELAAYQSDNANPHKILIVDDDPMNIEILHALIK